ncbi:MAG TPA: nuclear transport factor 2 family protein [Woeseiaceae bacterium]|nr:nuclear transport factor 2 family protein [Woeseiaceae bacterium]
MTTDTKKISIYISVASFAAFILVACQSGNDAQEALEEANLEKAVYCMQLLEIELDVDTADRECFAKSYVQHAPHVPDGRDAIVSFFAARAVKFPESSIEIKRAAADGDLVWMHLHSKRTPDARGSAIIHIFRMEDGKFAEHWEVGQPVPEESVHDNPMF